MSTTIPLEETLIRGDAKITSLELRRPMAGELRGVNLADLLQMDVGSIIKVLPRICTPTLTEAEAANLDPADLTQVGGAIAGFLLPRAALAAAQAAPSPSRLQ